MRTYKKSGGRMFDCTGKNAVPPAKLDMPETKRYIESLQGPNGRFSEADARTEALVLDALRILGCDDEKIYERAKEYLLTLKNPDWGFSQKPESESSSIEGTCHAVSALKELGVKKDEAADYVLRLHRGNGSFVGDANTPIDQPANGKVKYAYLAISTLKTSGRHEIDVFKRAKRFIVSRQHPNGGFGSSDDMFSDATLENTYYAVKALEKLDVLGTLGEKTTNYIAGLQNADGGFSLYIAGEISFVSGVGKRNPPNSSTGLPPRVSHAVRKGSDHRNEKGHFMKKKTTRSDIQNTFYAVSALDSLGRLDKDVCDGARDYIMKLKNGDGSFCHSRSEPGPLGEPQGTGTLLSTAYAVLCLGIVGGAKT